jgi:hypothetical protein
LHGLGSCEVYCAIRKSRPPDSGTQPPLAPRLLFWGGWADFASSVSGPPDRPRWSPRARGVRAEGPRRSQSPLVRHASSSHSGARLRGSAVAATSCRYLCGGSSKPGPAPAPPAGARPRCYRRTPARAAGALTDDRRLSAPPPRRKLRTSLFPPALSVCPVLSALCLSSV